MSKSRGQETRRRQHRAKVIAKERQDRADELMDGSGGHFDVDPMDFCPGCDVKLEFDAKTCENCDMTFCDRCFGSTCDDLYAGWCKGCAG